MCDTDDVEADSHVCKLLTEVCNTYLSCKKCQFGSEIRNMEDLVTLYAKMIYCVVNHESLVEGTIDVYNIYIVEMTLLNYVTEPECISVEGVLAGKYKNMEKTKNLIEMWSERQYITEFSEMNCEQCVESLTYKIHKRGAICDAQIDYLFVILYKRKEYKRFYDIYKRNSQSKLVNRLGYMLSLNEDCEYVMEDIGSSIKTKIDIDNALKTTNNIDLRDIICIENADNAIWQANTNCWYNWNEKVRLWKSNRCDVSGILDKMMIDECIKHKKYDEGWLLYTKGNACLQFEYHKVCVLCIAALENGCEDIWLIRIISIMKNAIDKHEVHVCCDLVHDLLYKISNLSENIRMVIVKEFIKLIRVMEDNEEIVMCIIKGITDLCKKCRNTETCSICVEHANFIYNEWKRNNTGGLFFKSHSKYENVIYECMLDMCDAMDDCKGFINVCKDLIDNEAKLNKGITKKLQTVHSKTCKNCSTGSCQINAISDHSQLCHYILNGYKL